MRIYKQPVSDQRIAFEAWYLGSHTSACLVRTRKGYISESTRVAWRAWQAALVSGVDSAAVLQLFTDPENQPTQHGTVTVDYMQREIAAEREACRAVAEAEIPKHEHFDDQRAAGNTARRIMAGIKARGLA